MNTLHVAILCFAALSAITVFVLARNAAASYRNNFVRRIGSGLEQNFLVGNPQRILMASASLAVLLGVIAWTMLGIPAGVLLAATCLVAPTLAIRTIAKRRVRRFIYQLPDALLALASALRAGSNLNKGLELLAKRQPPPLAQEFTIVLAQYGIGKTLEQSLRDMRQRIDAPELDLMNTAINVSRQVGGNLADTLESLAKTLQEKAHIEGKIDALTSMGRAQGWVVGLLPVFIGFVLYRQQPERMSLLFTQWYGWVVLAVVAAMMALAAWMIRKIVNIDV